MKKFSVRTNLIIRDGFVYVLISLQRKSILIHLFTSHIIHRKLTDADSHQFILATYTMPCISLQMLLIGQPNYESMISIIANK